MSVESFIIIGTLAIVMLVFFIILFVNLYQRKIVRKELELQTTRVQFQEDLLNATLKTEQKERERIAKNLHDEIGTTLNIIKLHIEKINRNADNQKTVSDTSEKTNSLLTKTIQEVRQISRSLMPSTLSKMGLIASIKELCNSIQDSGFCEINCNIDNTIFIKNEENQAHLFRIVQEIFNNLIKHAKPKFISINMYNSIGLINIQITHNGHGINDESIKKLYNLNLGVGLKSIESRVNMLKGTINYTINNEQESEIKITAHNG